MRSVIFLVGIGFLSEQYNYEANNSGDILPFFGCFVLFLVMDIWELWKKP